MVPMPLMVGSSVDASALSTERQNSILRGNGFDDDALAALSDFPLGAFKYTRSPRSLMCATSHPICGIRFSRCCSIFCTPCSRARHERASSCPLRFVPAVANATVSLSLSLWMRLPRAIGRGKGLQGALAFYFGEGRRAPAPSSFEYDALLTTWHVPISMLSVRTYNPIRQIVSSIRKSTSAESRGMELVPLSLGDPTIFKNMPICDTMIRTLHANIDSHDCDGYTHSCGIPSARKAIAKRYTLPISPVTKDDVIITSGCSGALNLAISAMIDEGDNVLLPCPGFALYNTIVRSRGGECRGYNLVAERGWECDLEHMESQIDSRTRCILINNPSNPCGSVFSLAHLQDIVTLAERHCLPIIADEIYGGIVFGGEEMHPLAAVSANVPIVTCGGIAKEFLVPGWRLGWIVVHDRNGILADCKAGMQRLATLTLGANTLVQSVLPAILTPGPGSEDALSLAAFHEDTSSILQANAEFLCAELADNPCLEVIAPAGGAYPIVGTVCAALHAHLIPPYRERGGAGAHCPFPTLRLCPSFLPFFLPSPTHSDVRYDSRHD